jgi:hypothetical protein
MDFRDLDSVELVVPIDDPNDGHFPAGTGGAIVDLGDTWALVEIVRDDGTTAGLVEVMLDDLRLVQRVPVG